MYLNACNSNAFNPNRPNGFSQAYQMGESTFIFRGIRSNLSFLFKFSLKIKIANILTPDRTPRFATSHLGIKTDARFICVKVIGAYIDVVPKQKDSINKTEIVL